MHERERVHAHSPQNEEPANSHPRSLNSAHCTRLFPPAESSLKREHSLIGALQPGWLCPGKRRPEMVSQAFPQSAWAVQLGLADVLETRRAPYLDFS